MIFGNVSGVRAPANRRNLARLRGGVCRASVESVATVVALGLVRRTSPEFTSARVDFIHKLGSVKPWVPAHRKTAAGGLVKAITYAGWQPAALTFSECR